jgi:hypothetical protein
MLRQPAAGGPVSNRPEADDMTTEDPRPAWAARLQQITADLHWVVADSSRARALIAEGQELVEKLENYHKKEG